MAEDGNLQFTSTVPIAGNSFTDAVAKILGVANSKAEEIKRKIGIANTANYPNIKIALLPVLNNLCAEIKSILRFHSEHSDRQVGRIILTGGSARLKNLPDFLAPQFADFPGLKLELANPWQSLPQLKQPPLDVYDSLSFTTAIGLAMRGMDFEP
jgi:Tfp pilus assembly PilM family ATPase